MPPVNNERHGNHTGTIPKTKVRNNCNVPQEAVTPTRRDLSTNLVSTSLDWVPVSEYNPRSNYNQSRKPTNNISEHEFSDLDNSVSFEGGFGRFVPVRPQPRALPLTAQNRDNTSTDHNDEGASTSGSAYNLHAYPHAMANGLIPHSNHAAAAVMIVNPTTPNSVTGNMTQPFNAPGNQNRNNLTRNLNSSRNNLEGGSNSNTINNNTTPPISNSRTTNKSVNIMNNMYDSAQSNSSNLNENNHGHRGSARALGDAMVAACPDAAAVERRLGQIREYIRVTSSLVDTMRNSEDEAFIEHTKEEYDELVEMVMKLKESETKLETILVDNPDNQEVPGGSEEVVTSLEPVEIITSVPQILDNDDSHVLAVPFKDIVEDETHSLIKSENLSMVNENLKKVLNIENEILNKSAGHNKVMDIENIITSSPIFTSNVSDIKNVEKPEQVIDIYCQGDKTENEEIETQQQLPKGQQANIEEENLKEILRQNIVSCSEKLSLIEDLKCKNKDPSCNENQDVVVRPISVQSNGSGFSENELWQNDIKNKMEISHQRLAALQQQQKRLLKYQAEAKQQLVDMNRARHSQELQPSTSHDNMLNQNVSNNFQHPNRMYAANQIGVATTLPHSSDNVHHQGGSQQNMSGGSVISSNADQMDVHINQEDRFSREVNTANSEGTGGARDSDAEIDDGIFGERARELSMKLRELQRKKQHMENLVSEFQKLEMATQFGINASNNTYSSSGDDSGDEEPAQRGNKLIKNEDPFKLMEIKAIKAALQKTKALMRSVETYEIEHIPSIQEDNFQMSNHSNINDNKSEGGGSMSGWSHEGSVCRVRNSLPPRQKFTNEQHLHQQTNNASNHEVNIASLQELAQQLRHEAENIMDERARLKDAISNKEFVRKQKKINEEVQASTSGIPGPVERRQMELRAILAEKQKQLEALLNTEKALCSSSGNQQVKTESCGASVVNQSYNSELEEPDSRSEQILVDVPSARQNESFMGSGDNLFNYRSINSLPQHLGSTYGSDSDSASRDKSNQRNRGRRRQPLERHFEDNNVAQANTRHEQRAETSSANLIPPASQNGDNGMSSSPFHHFPPPSWNNSKTNQDMHTNQFPPNSHSPIERMMNTPQLNYPPSMPFNMMMPYAGMVGGCGCGCGMWGAWCWQQLVLQQREIHQLREQLNHLEERWRVETATHTLNNQVPPGNRANNYWDNFRSYSRQNLLSANSKTNADGHLTVGPAHNPHPLVERSHNTLHPSISTPPSINTPKRNTNTSGASHQPPNNNEDVTRHGRRNITYERSLSFSSAPDVLNVNQNSEAEVANAGSHSRNIEEIVNTNSVSNVNLNIQDGGSNSFRNLNISNSIPEIVQSLSNNLNTSTNTFNSKKKSSSKLPAKNSAIKRNCSLDYAQTSNINIASTSKAPNPNLASTSREANDKTALNLFDSLKENVYSEVTALIGVNESHPDFLIQLFRELQLISSDSLRQKVLTSIRNILSQCSSILENRNTEDEHNQMRFENVTTITEPTMSFNQDSISSSVPNTCSSTQTDNNIIRFLLEKNEEVCTPELLEMLANQIINVDGKHSHCSKKALLEYLSKYEGAQLRNVYAKIIEHLPILISMSNEYEDAQQAAVHSESMLQDVAGSLSLFGSNDTHLHQLNACPYEIWPEHMHMDIAADNLHDDNLASVSHHPQEGKIDLINCIDVHNGDLAEADQTCHSDPSDTANSGREDHAGTSEILPDVVDTEETTPTEAEAEWLGLDRVPTRLHMDESPENQKE